MVSHFFTKTNAKGKLRTRVNAVLVWRSRLEIISFNSLLAHFHRSLFYYVNL